MTQLVRFRALGEVRIGALTDGQVRPLRFDSMGAALRVPLDELRAALDAAAPAAPVVEFELLAPVDTQEVWAAGVTYLRSRDARLEESGGADAYDRVYDAERPELFFKSPGWRVVEPGGAVGIRRDSGWDLPEPELAVVVNAHGEIAGYTIGNDVSSRSIEGANTLYLPQAKFYRQSCALGPGVLPAWELPANPDFDIRLEVRRGGATVCSEQTSTSKMRRRPADLADWLQRALDFPDGVVLMTGTGAVPGPEFTLAAGDEVAIAVSGIGTLTNTVELV